MAEAVAKVLPVKSLRWISFGHVESDKFGSMNMWLTAAPKSQVAYNTLGCDVSLNDLCDRPPRALAEGEVIDLGGKRVRQISTPHVPHSWEAQVLFEETTGTLFCGDLFTHVGPGKALTTDDVVGPALAAEGMFHSTSLNPRTGQTLRTLADLNPRTLAIMHGRSFHGDGGKALGDLAAAREVGKRIVEAVTVWGSVQSRARLPGALAPDDLDRAGAWRTTCSATLPMSQRLSPVRPWDPSTMMSAAQSIASWRISVRGWRDGIGLDLQTRSFQCRRRRGDGPLRIGLGHLLYLGDGRGADTLHADGQVGAGGNGEHAHRAGLGPRPCSDMSQGR